MVVLVRWVTRVRRTEKVNHTDRSANGFILTSISTCFLILHSAAADVLETLPWLPLHAVDVVVKILFVLHSAAAEVLVLLWLPFPAEDVLVTHFCLYFPAEYVLVTHFCLYFAAVDVLTISTLLTSLTRSRSTSSLLTSVSRSRCTGILLTSLCCSRCALTGIPFTSFLCSWYAVLLAFFSTILGDFSSCFLFHSPLILVWLG